jgi:4-hydroxyphenylpyruvate dioxygenase
MLAPVPDIDNIAFVELVLDQAAITAMTSTLAALGFARMGRHRTKPVEIWHCGRARILLNSGAGDTRLHPAGVAALGVATTDPWAAANRAAFLLAPRLDRRRGPAEADLPSIEAPDGTEIFFCPDDTGRGGWLADFTPDGKPAVPPSAKPPLITAVDHVALTQPFDRFDEATLFFRAMLGLRLQHSSEVAAPFGLVRNRAMVDPAGILRVCLSVSVLRRSADWHPGVTDPQHVALATDDILAAAAAVEAAGQAILRIPANYYDDLQARVDLPLSLLSSLRQFGILYDRNAGGEFLHFYTPIYGGRVFLEVVSRIGDYQAYGESNAPIRMASHRRLRT